MCFEGSHDRPVFGQRQLEAAPGVEQLTDAVEPEPRGFRGGADPFKAKVVLQEGVEGKIKAMKALQVLRLDGCPLIAQIAAELVDESRGCGSRQPAYCLDFKGTAQEHVFAGVGNLDECHARAALRDDVDEPLGCQAVHGLTDRKA